MIGIGRGASCFQKAHILVENIKQHISGAYRENGISLSDRREIKGFPLPGQHQNRNDFIVWAKHDFQIRAVLCSLQHFVRIHTVFHFKFKRENPILRDNQHIGIFSILVEVGHNKNTLRQALNSIPPLADALYSLMIEAPDPTLAAMSEE